MEKETYEQLLKKAENSLNEKKKQALSEVNKTYNNLEQSISDAYNSQINSVSADYARYYDKNALQQKINERNLNERMANLGLTDSGLNRTQQTALTLAKSNADLKVSKSISDTVKLLKSELSNKLAENRQKKSESQNEVNAEYQKLSESLADKLYDEQQKELEAEQKKLEAEQKKLEAEQKKSSINKTRDDLVDEACEKIIDIGIKSSGNFADKGEMSFRVIYNLEQKLGSLTDMELQRLTRCAGWKASTYALWLESNENKIR